LRAIPPLEKKIKVIFVPKSCNLIFTLFKNKTTLVEKKPQPRPFSPYRLRHFPHRGKEKGIKIFGEGRKSPPEGDLGGLKNHSLHFNQTNHSSNYSFTTFTVFPSTFKKYNPFAKWLISIVVSGDRADTADVNTT